MRLTDDEVAAIKDCARIHFGAGATVRLFGSRVRDDLLGGDIDLHVVAERTEQARGGARWKFLEALEARIGEQQIDVIVKGPEEPFEPIDHIAALTGVVL